MKFGQNIIQVQSFMDFFFKFIFDRLFYNECVFSLLGKLIDIFLSMLLKMIRSKQNDRFINYLILNNQTQIWRLLSLTAEWHKVQCQISGTGPWLILMFVRWEHCLKKELRKSTPPTLCYLQYQSDIHGDSHTSRPSLSTVSLNCLGKNDLHFSKNCIKQWICLNLIYFFF